MLIFPFCIRLYFFSYFILKYFLLKQNKYFVCKSSIIYYKSLSNNTKYLQSKLYIQFMMRFAFRCKYVIIADVLSENR